MAFFDKKTALQKEWEKLKKQEQRFLLKRVEKKDTLLNRTLADKVPPKLQSTLDTAFAKAFELVFERGTGVIEKTYKKEILEQEYQVHHYAAGLIQDKKSLRTFSNKARETGAKNLLLSGVTGIGMGVLGIGLPDIPVFTGMILKNVYEIALQHGYGYETKEEKYFILLVIQGAVSYGEALEQADRKLNEFIENQRIPEGYEEKEQIQKTAGMLSKELLYMKFLQGIPIAGVVGGVYDAVYMQRITTYAGLKYKRRKFHDFMKGDSEERLK